MDENQSELAADLAAELDCLLGGDGEITAPDVLDSLAVAGLALTRDTEKASTAYILALNDQVK